jgi:EAL domain-containing protein (putative c-di-GMP-specific phosphodiesterase class I)
MASSTTDTFSAAREHGWRGRIRRALAEDLFVLHFQPIVELRDGRVTHYEALLRLADEPDGEVVAPGRFLPAAERCGLVRDIDRMVIDRAIELLGSALGGSRAGIAVNVSACSVSDGRLFADLHGSLRRHRADPARLVIELTETTAISDMRRAREFCAGARALGCSIALDDFGTGFGSFQYLKQLPFDLLKIDGEFISALRVSRTDRLVVKAIVGLARGLERETIAEFVADQQTLGMLRLMGVDYAQGYELGRPSEQLALAA